MLLIAIFLSSLLSCCLSQICNCNQNGFCIDSVCVCNYRNFGAKCENSLEFYHADLSGANEVPPVSTLGSGIGRVSYNRVDDFVKVGYRVQDLTGTITAAHIHQAPAGSNGGVVVPIDISAPVTSMKPTNVNWNSTLLLTQGMYINVHTSFKGSGEVRGQLVPFTLPICPPNACQPNAYCVSELFGFECYCHTGFQKVGGSCDPVDYISSYLVNNNKVQLFRFLFRSNRDSSGKRTTIGGLNIITNSLLSDGFGTFSNNHVTTSAVSVTNHTCFVIHSTVNFNTTFTALRIRSSPSATPVLSIGYSSDRRIQLLDVQQKPIRMTPPVLLTSASIINYVSICYRPRFLIISVNGVRIADWSLTSAPFTPGNYIAQLGPNFAGIIDEFFAYDENQPLTSIDSTFSLGTK